MTTIDLFQDFLVERGIYNQFLYNYYSQKRDPLKEFLLSFPIKTPQSFINDCLTWDITEEGQDFWSFYHDEWEEYCKFLRLEERFKNINTSYLDPLF